MTTINDHAVDVDFQPCSTFIPPENIRKPPVFLMFSGGIEVEH